ncbi:unnamed protein product, partial [Owenia fusiformis]
KVIMLILFLAISLQAGISLAQDSTLYWCECSLLRENGSLGEIQPVLEELTGAFVNLDDRTECIPGDLNICDQYCRDQIRSGNLTFETVIADGSDHENETYGDHMCHEIHEYNPSELPIGSPGYRVFAFSRMQECVTLDTTWYTFIESQFDPPNNLCCDANEHYVKCNAEIMLNK